LPVERGHLGVALEQHDRHRIDATPVGRRG
jgi:hypothetical protein